MGEAFEIALEVIEHGFTIVTLISILHILFNWFESRKKRQAYERMEAKIDAIMQKEGVAWDGQPNGSHKVLTSLRWLYHLFSVAVSRVEYQFQRRGNAMQVSKTWLAGLIAYILGIISQKFGITFGDQAADAAANVIITIILPLVLAFMNRKKVKSDEVRPTDTKSAV